jgi:hypothetical protein
MKMLIIILFALSFDFDNAQSQQPKSNPTITASEKANSEANTIAMDTTIRPFRILCISPQEVRMGAPYNSCKIELVGQDKINLPKASWQDKYAWTNDSKKLVLIKWDFENNEPGFHLFYIDTETGRTIESKRIFGLPNSISIVDNKVTINKFLFDKTKSVAGKLCCQVNEEFEFPL